MSKSETRINIPSNTLNEFEAIKNDTIEQANNAFDDGVPVSFLIGSTLVGGAVIGETAYAIIGPTNGQAIFNARCIETIASEITQAHGFDAQYLKEVRENLVTGKKNLNDYLNEFSGAERATLETNIQKSLQTTSEELCNKKIIKPTNKSGRPVSSSDLANDFYKSRLKGEAVTQPKFTQAAFSRLATTAEKDAVILDRSLRARGGRLFKGSGKVDWSKPKITKKGVMWGLIAAGATGGIMMYYNSPSGEDAAQRISNAAKQTEFTAQFEKENNEAREYLDKQSDKKNSKNIPYINMRSRLWLNGKKIPTDGLIIDHIEGFPKENSIKVDGADKDPVKKALQDYQNAALNARRLDFEKKLREYLIENNLNSLTHTTGLKQMLNSYSGGNVSPQESAIALNNLTQQSMG